MPSSYKTNSYYGLADAISQASPAIMTGMFGDPAAKAAYAKAQAEADYRAQQQQNWERSHGLDVQRFGLSQNEDVRKQGMYQYDLEQSKLEADKLRRELASKSSLADFFSAPDTIQIDQYGNRSLNPSKVPEYLSILSEVNPEVAANQDRWGNPDIPQPVQSGGAIFWDPRDPRNPNYQSPAGSSAVEVPLPQASPAPSAVAVPPPAAPPAASAPSVADEINLPPPAFYSAGQNVTVVPKKDDGMFGTENSNLKIREEAGAGAMQASSIAKAAEQMIGDDQFLEKTQLGVGIPGIDSVISGAANLFDTENAMAARQFAEITIGDWLQKTTLLKGAITERETAQLRASQPPQYASAENKKQWLQGISWAMNKEAAWQQARFNAAKQGMSPPDPVVWSNNYEQSNPRPDLLNRNASPSPLGDAVAPQTQMQIPAGISPQDWQFMTPEERSLFQQ